MGETRAVVDEEVTMLQLLSDTQKQASHNPRQHLHSYSITSVRIKYKMLLLAMHNHLGLKVDTKPCMQFVLSINGGENISVVLST